MKKKMFYLFALLCSMSLFTACSDDDDAVDYSKVIEEEIAGNYKGLMDVFYEEPELEIAQDMVQKITIKKSSSTSLGLELKNFSITLNGATILIGDLALDNCPLTVEGEKYSFSGDAELDLVVGKCATSIVGSVVGSTIELTIKVNVDNGAMKVRVEYEGTKMTGNESSEALIKEFKFESDIIAEQPVINEEDRTITFKVVETATADDLRALIPIITYSENATITPESGVAQDFSENKVVVYKVTSEDGETMREYKVFARKSSDALITGFTFDNPIVAEQPVINEDNTITFKVKASATANDLSALVPTITCSYKATVSPESGVAQDFSNNKHVTYTVTSEDGTVTKEYDVYVSEVVEDRLIYNFDGAWQAVSDDEDNPDKTWLSPSPVEELASANQGVQSLMSMMGYTGTEFAMSKEVPGYNGTVNAVKLKTLKTKGLKFELLPGVVMAYAPAITPGTLYTGAFVYDMIAGMDKEGQLGMTHFGLEYSKKPVTFKGAYKYKKGTNYIDGSSATGKSSKWNPDSWTENLNIDDKGLIIAVLFEVGDDISYLDGNNLMDETKHVMRAVVGGDDYISDTNGEWKTFEIPFEEVSTYDPSKQYKLAIVCQSSKDGADFKGAENSTLIVDELEVIGE